MHHSILSLYIFTLSLFMHSVVLLYSLGEEAQDV